MYCSRLAGWLSGWLESRESRVEAIVASRRRRLDVVGLVDLWTCGLVGMIVVVRLREEPGEGHCWMVGSLDGWRVGGLAERREEGIAVQVY